jgi:uncharacterized protein YbjT (DUF2867 family)
VLTADVADALAAAVDAPVRSGEHIDLGWDRPLSAVDLAQVLGGVTGRRPRVLPLGPVLSAVLGVVGRFKPGVADFRAMFAFFASGRYVADPTRQGEVLQPVPRAEEAVARWLHAAGG